MHRLESDAIGRRGLCCCQKNQDHKRYLTSPPPSFLRAQQDSEYQHRFQELEESNKSLKREIDRLKLQLQTAEEDRHRLASQQLDLITERDRAVDQRNQMEHQSLSILEKAVQLKQSLTGNTPLPAHHIDSLMLMKTQLLPRLRQHLAAIQSMTQ